MEMDPVVGLFGQQCLDGVNCSAVSLTLLILFSALSNKKQEITSNELKTALFRFSLLV